MQMNTRKIDEAYAVLGLRPGACRQEIAQAWKDLTSLWDPAMHSIGSKSYEQCVRMLDMTNAAYELLTAPESQEPVSEAAAATAPAAAPTISRAGDFPDELFAAAKQLEIMSLAEAVEAYKRLAQIGHLKSQFRLGYLYFDGPMKDVTQAGYWWKRAADQGHVGAQFNLGLMYERGVGMPRDPHQAYFWFSEAAKHGDIQAKNKLKAYEQPQPQSAPAQSPYKKESISAAEMQALLPWAPMRDSGQHAAIDPAAKDFVQRKKQVS